MDSNEALLVLFPPLWHPPGSFFSFGAASWLPFRYPFCSLIVLLPPCGLSEATLPPMRLLHPFDVSPASRGRGLGGPFPIHKTEDSKRVPSLPFLGRFGRLVGVMWGLMGAFSALWGPRGDSLGTPGAEDGNIPSIQDPLGRKMAITPILQNQIRPHGGAYGPRQSQTFCINVTWACPSHHCIALHCIALHCIACIACSCNCSCSASCSYSCSCS